MRGITPYGHIHLTVVVDLATERELEIFAQIGKSAEMVASDMEGLCRLASLYLRSGGSLNDIIKQLVGIGSTISLHKDFKGEREKTHSLPDSLGKALRAYATIKKEHGIREIIAGDVELDPDLDLR